MQIFGATPSQKHGSKPSWVTSWSPHASPWNTRSAYSEHLLGRFSLLHSHGSWCSLSNDGTHSCRTQAGEMGVTPVWRDSTRFLWVVSGSSTHSSVEVQGTLDSLSLTILVSLAAMFMLTQTLNTWPVSTCPVPGTGGALGAHWGHHGEQDQIRHPHTLMCYRAHRTVTV